ncbi:MAG: LPS export ABC transporter permease LptF [Candidatus Thiosymbion ectosymbiont of Robbea hypermnestra]|nr:LPS export ABC transporter permease LptF [Candidatus Thiosymbion ectosymbiont of Robbea hypermnestra]
MFGIVDRYILLEVLKVFTAVLGTFLLVVLSMLFLRTLEEVNLGALGSDLVMRFVGLQLVRETSSLIPPAFFISVLIALGRMSRDSELIALSACGLGAGRIYRALLYLVLPVALLTAWFSFSLRPLAIFETQKILHRREGQIHQIGGIKQGRFYQHEQGLVTVYVEKIEGKERLRNVFIHDRRGDRSRLVISKTGVRRIDEASGDPFVTLLKGHRYNGVPGQPDYAIGTFERYSLRLEPTKSGHFRSWKRAAFRTAELIGSPDPRDRAELQYRIGNPLAIVTLTLLTVPLTTKSPRRRAGGRMFLAFLTYFSFFNLQRLAENWFATGVTPGWLGSLWYQALVLVLVLAILLPEGYQLRRLIRRSPRAAPG